MYTLTAPLLYSVIVSDDIPAIFHGHEGSNPIEGIPSKRELLQSTKRLFVEYPDWSRTPSYNTLLASSRSYREWHQVGARPTVSVEDPRVDWYLDDLVAAVPQLGFAPDGNKWPLDSLVTLSVGAYYGGPGEGWDQAVLSDREGRYSTTIALSIHIMGMVTHGDIQHFCASDRTGPFSPRRFEGRSRRGDPCQYVTREKKPCCSGALLNLHLKEDDYTRMNRCTYPAIFGTSTCWYVDSKAGGVGEGDLNVVPDGPRKQSYHEFSYNISDTALNHLLCRENRFRSDGSIRLPQSKLDLSVYVPMWSPEPGRENRDAYLRLHPEISERAFRMKAERFMLDNVASSEWGAVDRILRQEGFWHELLEEERHKVLPLFDASECPACGWLSPEWMSEDPEERPSHLHKHVVW